MWIDKDLEAGNFDPLILQTWLNALRADINLLLIKIQESILISLERIPFSYFKDNYVFIISITPCGHNAEILMLELTQRTPTSGLWERNEDGLNFSVFFWRGISKGALRVIIFTEFPRWSKLLLLAADVLAQLKESCGAECNLQCVRFTSCCTAE